jgi:hypothetical protein
MAERNAGSVREAVTSSAARAGRGREGKRRSVAIASFYAKAPGVKYAIYRVLCAACEGHHFVFDRVLR